jgi:uncharacterized membrane protein
MTLDEKRFTLARAWLEKAAADLAAALIIGLQHFAVEDRYPLLTPRDVPIESISALVPEVEAEVTTLRSEIAAQSGGSKT